MADRSKEITLDVDEASLESLEQTSQRLERTIYEKITAALFDELRDLTLKWKSASYHMDFYVDASVPVRVECAEYREKVYLIGYMKGLLGLAGRFGRKQWERQQIQAVTTRYRDNLLLALYYHKQLYHGELAKQLHVSPANLNGIIKRMNKCQVALLNIESNSKYTIYSLSLPALDYIKEVLLPAMDSSKEDSLKFIVIEDFSYGQKESLDQPVRLINQITSSSQNESFVAVPIPSGSFGNKETLYDMLSLRSERIIYEKEAY